MRRKTKREKVAELLNALGYKADPGSIRVVFGPKVKNDILEAWSVECLTHDAKRASIYSSHTLTELSKGLRVELNNRNTCLYGDYVAIPNIPVVKG